MNKVFKVIWSEARNAYVVVSEMAKSHGTKSCSTKKLLAMLIATGVMTCASMAPAMADNLAPTETKIEIGKDASASGEGSVAIGQKAVASNLVAIAIGRDAVASGEDSIAIGSDTKATQNYSVAVGNDIGFTAYAGTAVGQQAYASGNNATAIGTMTNIDTKYNASHDDWRKAGEQSTAIGAYAGSWGLASTAVGGYSKAEGKLATAIGYHSQANVDYGTALGDYSEVKAGWGVAIGASSFADRESGVIGLYAPDEDKDSLTWKATKGAVSVGSATITRQITNVAAGSEDTDAVNVAQLKAVKAAAGKKVSLVDGENTKATLVKDDATGTQYKVDVDLSKYAKTEDVAVVYDQNKTSLRSTNASVAENAIALGKGASAVKDSVAIGNGAYTQDGTWTKGQSVALGNGAVTGAKSTSIGSNAIGGREGTITIGANANNGSLYATIIGTDSKVNYMTRNSGAAATIVGAKSEIKNDNKSYCGVANGIFGSANTIENSNGVTIQGSGNTVTNAYKNMDGWDFDLGGVYVKKDAGAVGVIGGMNTVSNQIYTNVIGFGNTVAGDADNISHDVFVAGSRNNLSKVSDSIVMGNDNEISDRSNVISLGHENSIKANNAVAIGNGASVSAEGGVALGIGSVASTAAGALGYGADGKTDATWQATKGAVSVGGNGVTRQITNVAAGTEDTDAVNVAQLKKVSDTANAGWNLATNGVATEATNVKPGDYVDFSGDDENITVSKEENEYATLVKVNLNRDLNVDSVHAGDFFMNNDMGIGFGGSAYITKNGLNANDKVITNVAAGVYNTDAVNVGQLKKVEEVAANANKGWNLSTNGFGTEATNVKPGDYVDFRGGDENITVSKEENEYATLVKVNLNRDLNVDSVHAGDFFMNNDMGIGFGGSAYITKNGLNANDKVITNVAAGVYNTDAVNVGQLNAVATEAGKHTTLSNGKNTTVESTVKDGQTDYKVNVAGDLTDITSVANGDSKINLNKDSIIISNGNKYFAITNSGIGMSYIGADYSAKSIMLGENGTTISGGLNVAGSKITGVAAGVADTDAVNVGQLNAAVQAGNTDTHIKAGEYGVGPDNKVNMQLVDKNGKDAGTVTITDVAKASDVGDVKNIASDIKNKEGKTTVVDAVNNLNNKLDTKVGDLQYSKVEKGDIADGDSTTTAIGKLDQKLTDVAATAAKHTKVEGSSNIIVTNTAQEGEAANYEVKLNKDIDVDTVKANSVTTGQTVMDKDGLKVGTDVSLNKDGLKVGDKVSVSATAVTAGKTSISDEGVKVGDKTYINDKGLNANGQHITNVKAGEADTDAVNYGQLKDTNNRINGVENQVISNSNRINQLGNRVNKVGAGAAALAALHPMDFDPDDKLTFSAGYGNYGGENAAAIGAYYRPDEKVMFSVAGTVGNGENMVNAGVSFALDRTNHVSNSRTALAREVIDLRGQLAVMGAKMAKMEKAFGMLDETKTKLFPDIPANHWAYEYIAKLAGNGYIEGYPDGNFGGDRLMTRYEFAAMLYRAIENGAALEEKIIKEFEPELGRIRVDRISGEDGDRDKIERVRVNDTKGERDHYGNKLAK